MNNGLIVPSPLESPGRDEAIKKLIGQAMVDRAFRKEVTTKKFEWFMRFYFPRHITYTPARFHREMYDLIERNEADLTVIMAFRGSGKTTLFNLIYPIWAITGIQQKKHVVILGKTMTQARQYLWSIKDELDSNNLLRNDLGPFHKEDEWNMASLVIPKYQARITAASSEQGIRGIKHGPYRPDLIVIDDVEDSESVRTQESRDRIANWILSDIFPLGDRDTKIAVVGNLLHEDSLVSRLIKEIDEKKRSGTYRMYPLIDDHNVVLWPGKYPNEDAVVKQRLLVGNEAVWRREYLLQIVPDEDQVVPAELIHYYDEIPEDQNYRITYLGVDLAISQRENADRTALVPIMVRGYGEKFAAYVLPSIVNAHMDFPTTIKTILDRYQTLTKEGHAHVLIENVQYQQAAVEQLKNQGLYNVEGIAVTTDKRSRLAACTDMLFTGKIRFPRRGAEDLIRQLVGFGTERHDDLVDAFTLVVRKIIQEIDPRDMPHIVFLDSGPCIRPRTPSLRSNGSYATDSLFEHMGESAQRINRIFEATEQVGDSHPLFNNDYKNNAGPSGNGDFFAGFARGDFLRR